MFKKAKSNSVLTATISVLYGIILIIWPETNARILGYVIAAAIICVGIVYVIQYIKKDVVKDFYKRELVFGLCAMILGLILLLKVSILESIIPIILGIIILFSGVVKLQNAFDLLRLEANNWGWVLFFAAINVLFGVLVILNPVWINNILFRLIGIALIYGGVSDFVTMGLFGKVLKNHDFEEEVVNGYTVVDEDSNPIEK